jgi:hypothetical protein
MKLFSGFPSLKPLIVMPSLKGLVVMPSLKGLIVWPWQSSADVDKAPVVVAKPTS